MKLHLGELSRRGVFKTLAAYAVASWVLIEVSSVLAEAFLLPGWLVAGLTTALVIGAIPVILLSWRYDITWEGIKRDTSSVPAEFERSARLVSGILAVILLTIITALWVNYFRTQTTSEVESLLEAQQGAPEIGDDGEIRSIAVLPFDDFSPEGGKQLLADGISEAILHVLAQNRNLVVTSRKSSFMFRDKDMSAAEIGRILNVQALLEGSVQIVKDQLRVTSQLIRTSDQAHIWSNVYEAPLDDLFKVNDEIAREVRDLVLPADLSQINGQGWSHPPSVEAFQLLLEARELIGDLESTETAIRLFNVITGLWPDYADAWAWLAMAHDSKSYALRDKHTVSYTERMEVVEESARAADKALELNPKNHLALLLKASKTTTTTAEHLHDAMGQVLESAPNDPSVLEWLAGLMMYSANFQEAEKLLTRARAVEPSNYEVLESFLWSKCGVTPQSAMVETQLQDYPVSRVKALRFRALAQFCDRQYVDFVTTSFERARISNDPEVPFRTLIHLASLGHQDALALMAAAHRLLPRQFNGPPNELFIPTYFTEILPEGLEIYRRHMNSEFANRNGTPQMYAIALVMAGDYENAEKNIDGTIRLWEGFYASEDQIVWHSDTYALFAWKSWFLVQRGEGKEAGEIAQELLRNLEKKGNEQWSGSRGRLIDLPLMILLLNGMQSEAVDWLLDAERDQWLYFQAVLTSPFYAEFRKIPEVSAALARLLALRAGVLDEVMATGMPEVLDPSILLEYTEALLTTTHHEQAQIALHFDDDPARALQYYEQALESDPENLEIISQVIGFALELGLVDDAVALSEHLVSLAPKDARIQYDLAVSYGFAELWEDAISSTRKSLELDSNSGAVQRWLGMMLIQNGEPRAAMEIMQGIEDDFNRKMGMIMAHYALGEQEESDAVMQEWLELAEGSSPFHLAYTLAFRNDRDLAFEWLEKAATVRKQVANAAVFPFLSNLHDDPRWLPFLESIGKSPEQLAGIEFDFKLPE